MANKQISNLYLKKAAAALKGAKYADAVAAATKATEFGDNAQAFLVAGQASQKLGKNNDAIKHFEKYLEAAPKAKNANAIAFTVAALYQKAGNKAKAAEFYKKVVGDPQLGAQAKQQLDALK
jgi:tetratricopeptide (TPR) repeat protein